MTDFTNDQLNELFPGWEPVITEETDDIDFSKPIRGKYDVEIDSVAHRKVSTQDGDKDLISFKLKVTKDISGDTSYNRYLDKTFWMGSTKWDEDPDAGLKQMVSSLESTELNYSIVSKTDFEAVASSLNTELMGNTIRVRTYPNKNNKQVVIFVRPKASDDEVGNPLLN